MSNIIGIIPVANKTFEVCGDFTCTNPIEGKLYYDPNTKILYYYSKTLTRSNPETGYFPVWNGETTFKSSFSKKKTFDNDVLTLDVASMSSNINKDIADRVLYNQRRSTNLEILNPKISDGDNMFTQCVKGVITQKQITMIDLIDMCNPSLPEKVVENYYNALTKITFMRLDKWSIWINTILHVKYVLDVFKGNKRLIRYEYPKDKFDTGIVKYDDIIKTAEDPFKKIIKILMIMENINKSTLRGENIDDYTVNNMMTTINSTKALSAQLFSRFIQMSDLSYKITLYDYDGSKVFEYKE